MNQALDEVQPGQLALVVVVPRTGECKFWVVMRRPIPQNWGVIVDSAVLVLT